MSWAQPAGTAAPTAGRLPLPAAVAAVNAAMLGQGISYATAIRGAAAGDYPAERDGRCWIVRARDVAAIAAFYTKRNTGRAMRRPCNRGV